MSRRKTERLLSLVVCLLSARRYLTAAQIREAVPGYPDVVRGVQAHVRAGQGRAARARHPAGDRHQRGPATRSPATGSHGRPTSCPRSGWSRTRRRCSGWRPGLAAGRAGRRGRGRAAEAAGGRDRGRGPEPARNRAAGADAGGGVRAAVGGGPGPAAGLVRLPGRGPQRRAAAQARAVGSGQPARPLVRGRPGHRPRRPAGVPAEPDRRPGDASPARPGRSACRPAPTCGARSGTGTPSRRCRAPACCGSGPAPGTACGGTRSASSRTRCRAGTWSR